MSYTFKKALYDSSIAAESLRLFGIIIDLSKKSRTCDKTNSCLAKIMNCSLSTISRSLRELKEKGYINIIMNNGNKRNILYI